MDTLVDKLLKEQATLQTPVARFSKSHDNHELRTDLYKHLIPLEKPREGEQYAFQVELDKCTGCKACVVACHTLNGLDEDEAWRDVGLLESGNGFQQTVTTACHHCLDPECLKQRPGLVLVNLYSAQINLTRVQTTELGVAQIGADQRDPN